MGCKGKYMGILKNFKYGFNRNIMGCKGSRAYEGHG